MKVFATTIIVAVLFLGSCAKRAAPTSSESNQPQAGDTGIRVLCYNIHHANPPSKPGVIDIAAIARVITESKAHLVALQEVDVHTERSGKNLHQAEELAKLTGMQFYFGKAIDYGGGEYGVAILSKYEMESQRVDKLPTLEGTNGEPRVVASAIIRLPGGQKIRFASTHLDAQRSDTNRLLQATRLVELMKAEELPLIVAGDLNADPQSRVIAVIDQHFTRTCKTNCAFTIPVINPTKTIDFITFAPSDAFEIKQHRVINETYASDHLPVLAELKLR